MRTSFTFYSGIGNLDFEIGAGNPAAIAGAVSRGAALIFFSTCGSR